MNAGGDVHLLGGGNQLYSGLLGAGVSIYSNTDDRSVGQDLSWSPGAVWSAPNGTITVDASGEISVGGSMDGGSLILTSGGDLNVNDLTDLAFFDVVEISSPDAFIAGDVSTETGTITLNAANSLTVSGGVEAGGDLVLNVGSGGQLISGLLGAGVSVYSNTDDSGPSNWTWDSSTSAPNGTINIASDGPISLDGEFDWNDAYGDFSAAQAFDPGIVEFDGPVVYHHHANGSDIVTMNIYSGDRD